MSIALCIWVLFISLLQSVNGAQILNATFLTTLFRLSPTYGATFIVPHTSI